MEATKGQVLRSFIDLVCAGELEEAFTRLDPGVVVHEADGLPYAGEFRGPAGFAALLRQVYEVVELKIEHADLLEASDTVVARMRTTLTSRSSGRSIAMPITEIYTFTPDRQIFYADVFYKGTAAVTELVGEGAGR